MKLAPNAKTQQRMLLLIVWAFQTHGVVPNHRWLAARLSTSNDKPIDRGYASHSFQRFLELDLLRAPLGGNAPPYLPTTTGEIEVQRLRLEHPWAEKFWKKLERSPAKVESAA